MNQRLKQRLLMWLRISILTTSFGALILVLKKDYTLRGYCDATFIPGITLLFVWLLKLLADKGSFDVVGYGLSRIVNGMRRKEERTMVAAHEFIENKKERRRKADIYYLPYLVVSGIYLIASIILLFLI